MENNENQTPKADQALLNAAEKRAKKLEEQIAKETAKFNKKIEELGKKSGLNLGTEVSIIFK